ncbi:hypothetical protein SAMN05421636_1016 [Pricia antarctica]|uniref:Uncharacterized protein n=1 Tax=Pricia antarctica TaxID=641691 RepID=A0A1G6VN05_9FLAO|nr:hypothetical protein SAMN05421636_1016 [Pricia antarctica]
MYSVLDKDMIEMEIVPLIPRDKEVLCLRSGGRDHQCNPVQAQNRCAMEPVAGKSTVFRSGGP